MLRNAKKRLMGWVRRRVLSAESLNLRQCSVPDLWNDYFRDAVRFIDEQWEQIIWPLIAQFDFSAVVELAPGAGRNTAKLCPLSGILYAVDLNDYALRQCKQYVEAKCPDTASRVRYVRNDGKQLAAIPDGTITAIYSWDSAVHFDRSVLQSYIAEFARVLKPGGKGFVHHSDLGDRADKDIDRNPHLRSNMSAELFARYCKASGLEVVVQREIPWSGIVDCVTVFRKPEGRA